jgi:hypothetical protein
MDGGYAVPQGKPGFLDPELPGFGLGEVEDVVDDVEEMLAAGLDSLDAFALFGGVRRVSRSSAVMPMTALIGVRIS